MKSLKSILSIWMLLTLLVVSCVETTCKVTTISFNPKSKIRDIFDVGLFKGVKLVRLESDGCIVGNIDKIISNDSLIYIMDQRIAKEVYVFTRNGRFVSKISRYGHGKYEYTQLWDIFFDKDRNALCLLSRYDQKIISFTPDGKRVLEEIKLPKMFGHIVPTSDGYIGYMDNYSQNPNMPYNIWTMDKSYNLQDGFMPINPQFESTSFADLNMFSVYGDALYYKPEYVNTIYQIKDGEIVERYRLDFGERTLADYSSLPPDNTPAWFKIMSEKISNVFNYEETDDYILMDFIMNGQTHLGIFNKADHSSEIASLGCYDDEIIFSFGQIKGMDQSAIYSVVDNEGVYDMWLGHNEYNNFEELYPQQVENLRKLFPHLEENGNPFVAIYSLK